VIESVPDRTSGLSRSGAVLDLPGVDELRRFFDRKYSSSEVGWGPRLRSRFQYFSPDDVYEALIERLITAETAWLDVGCGRHIFPSNAALAKVLSERCRLLVGVDPDVTIEENAFVHRSVRTSFEDYLPDTTFDVVTMRMVAEHVTHPESVVASIRRATHENSLVVIYTPFKWSIVSLITRLTPFVLHQPVKRLLWRTEQKDTFPVAFKMNTRHALRGLFCENGFEEAGFWYLDDCRSTSNIYLGSLLELSLWKALRTLRLRYPELCVLGAFRRL
jgi:hypothetical protein